MMNQGPLLLGMLCAAMVGVGVLTGTAAEPPIDTEKIGKEARETIEATKQYTVQQKEAFERKAHEELAAIQKKIDALREKARGVSTATKTELQKSIAELEKEKDAARHKLDELATATDAKWSAVKASVNSAIDELKSSYRKAVSRLP